MAKAKKTTTVKDGLKRLKKAIKKHQEEYYAKYDVQQRLNDKKRELLLKNLKKKCFGIILGKNTISCSGIDEDDLIYRFYHNSFKVYGLQKLTLEYVKFLQGILPKQPLNKKFLKIIAEGTGKEFKLEDNRNWEATTRPIIEAYFHAKFFISMAFKYASLAELPQMLPSGWAALLYLYNLR